MKPVDTDRLQQKVIVIVGGTSGLGLSAAAACVRAGASVVVEALPPGFAREMVKIAAEVGVRVIKDRLWFRYNGRYAEEKHAN